MSNWTAIKQELDAWDASGRRATFWWRDDDAARVTAQLLRLLRLSREYGTPLFLAVIPRTLEPQLATVIREQHDVWVLQHGYAHLNHAPPAQKKCEFPDGRPLPLMVAELSSGRERLLEACPELVLPILVPPWNRITASLLKELPAIGFAGISAMTRRQVAEPVAGLQQINAHVDIIDWHNNRRFVGTEHALTNVLDHLAARRCAHVDSDEPTGLLTHHLIHDEQCWVFLRQFLRRTHAHPAVRWLGRHLLR